MELKRGPGADRGIEYAPYVMDFGHVRGEKGGSLWRLRIPVWLGEARG